MLQACVRLPADLRLLPPEELPSVADSLRREVIEAVALTGGHLGAGLGVVELTLALHYVFNTPDDRLIWDVGHQSYPHKILTGRGDRMATLRRHGGLSGFTCRAESVYDPFGAAHSSTALSAALGMATARNLQADSTRKIVCVVGDGAMSAGMAFEALNNLAACKGQLTLVLNDNDLSIAPSVGALTNHFKDIKKGQAPLLWQALGLRSIGPIDGHNFDELLPALQQAADATEPVIVHVVTRKGKGHPPSEAAADGGHAAAPFDPLTGQGKVAAAPAAPTYTKVFANTLCDLAAQDPRVVAITAAMPEGTGLSAFAARFPERFFDVGIAEQHAVTFAAGLAAEGYKPFVAVYSTFLQRAYDQLVHDVAIQQLPVRFMVDRAGLVGADGATHAGSFDVASAQCLPGMVLMAPSDEAELCHAVTTAYACDHAPSMVRYPRGEGVGAVLPSQGTVMPIGRSRTVLQGRDVALLAYGTRLQQALICGRQHGCTVIDARFAKPLDTETLAALQENHSVIITLEDGVGFGHAVLQSVADLKLNLRVYVSAMPDRFVGQGNREEQWAEAGYNTVDAMAIDCIANIKSDKH